MLGPFLVVHQTQLRHHFRRVPPCFAHQTALLSSPVLSFHHLLSIEQAKKTLLAFHHSGVPQFDWRYGCLCAFLEGGRVVVLLSGAFLFFLFLATCHFAVMKAENNLDRETCVISAGRQAGRQAGKLVLAHICCQAAVSGAFSLVHLMKTSRKHARRHKYDNSYFFVVLLTF